MKGHIRLIGLISLMGLVCLNAHASGLKFSLKENSADASALGYTEVLDEGSILTKRRKVNFIGAGSSCVDNAGSSRTDCTMTGGGGSSAVGQPGQVQFMSSDVASLSADPILVWFQNSNTLNISRDSGQVGEALRISSDTGARLANISHDGAAYFDSLQLATWPGTNTWGSGSTFTWTFDVGVTDPTIAFLSGAITITPGGLDFTVADDVRIEDATPFLLLTDTTAAQDDFQLDANVSIFTLNNNTDSVNYLSADASHEMVFGSTSVPRIRVITSGTGVGRFVVPSLAVSTDAGALTANISNDGSAFFDSLQLNTSLSVIEGGTGASTHTDGSILLGNGTAAITNTGVLAQGVLVVGDGTTDPTLLTVGANGTVLSADSAQTSGVKWEAITKPSRHYYWPASALLPLEAGADSISVISKDSGANLDNLNRAFDAATDECVTGTMEVPSDVKMDGTVTIRAKAYAVAPATTFVLWKFNHVPVGPNESWDSALSAVSFDGVAFSATQDQLTVASDTATISSLGWVSSDTVFFTFCRDADTAGDTLVNDALLIDLSVDIPRG